MAEDLTVNNKKVSQTSLINPDGSVSHYINVSFMLGTHGPFTFTRPSAQFNAADLNQAIQTFRNQIAAIQ